MLIVHETVTLDFGKGFIISLIKDMDGNKMSSENYRGIILSPVLRKFVSVGVNE